MSERPANTARSIVVVEDEALVRELAVCELEEAGFRVFDFATADEALSHLALHAADTALLFTDVQMPGRLNGLELTAIVSRTWPAIDVIVTSGGCLVNPVRLPARSQFMPKPWRGADLVSRIAGLPSREVPFARQRLDAAML